MKKLIYTLATVTILAITAINCQAAPGINDGKINKDGVVTATKEAKHSPSVETKQQGGETKATATAALSDTERNDLRNEISDLKTEANVTNSNKGVLGSFGAALVLMVAL